ncbi:hypothetical protein FRC19_003902 [Serendipita sp. 401]|nr:hypothetical protein FRC19_003902 [Serendipita sp. 401]
MKADPAHWRHTLVPPRAYQVRNICYPVGQARVIIGSVLSRSFPMESLEHSWKSIVGRYTPLQIEVVGTAIVQLLTFYLPCVIYMSLPLLAPEFSMRHKLQKQEKQPTAAQIKDAFLVVMRNQTIALVLQFLSIYNERRRGYPSVFDLSPQLPTLTIFLRDIFIMLVVREMLFYYIHRLFHTKRLYPYIHKIHHRFTAPCALAAQYAHPFEHIVCNVAPIFLPGALMKSHVLTFWVFLAAMLIETSTVHSGYDFWPHLAEKHDRHHEVFMWNYGASLDWFDWLHGTKEKTKAKNTTTGGKQIKKD